MKSLRRRVSGGRDGRGDEGEEIAVRFDCAYLLPLRYDRPRPVDELAAYLAEIPFEVEVVVVDGSPAEVFRLHAARFPARVRHTRPDVGLRTMNGKVGAVLTGLRDTRHERVVIADEDVRYDAASLDRLLRLLDRFDLVRPQNHFQPAPWHTHWDAARSLLNRVTGGDWPGTIGVRRSRLLQAGGYRGDVLFENLELARTIRAAGGSECVPLDLYVRRLPPSAGAFLGQRVRQAYDELARPARLAVWLGVLPGLGYLTARRAWPTVLAAALAVAGAAEVGRRRAGGGRVFPISGSLLAPLWVVERSLCSWLALGSRLLFGGVRYRGLWLRDAASSEADLRRRRAGAAQGQLAR